jgi:hypothetical protein
LFYKGRELKLQNPSFKIEVFFSDIKAGKYLPKEIIKSDPNLGGKDLSMSPNSLNNGN